MNAEFQRIARRDKKAFLSDQSKEREESNRMGKASDHFKEIRDTIGTNKSCKNGHSKGQKQRDLKKKKILSEVARIHRRIIQKRS